MTAHGVVGSYADTASSVKYGLREQVKALTGGKQTFAARTKDNAR